MKEMKIPRFNQVKPIVIFLFLMVGGLFFTGTSIAKSDDGTSASQKWAVVNGFRSANFGMKERDVLKAIKKDFGIGKSQVSRKIHPNEKTVTLGIQVDKLLPESGPAKVFYIMGYKSKRLIHINVIWGKPITKKPNAEAIVATANQLRNHFAQKKYQKEGFALNAPLGEGVILVFQGKDRKGRAAKILLVNPKVETKDGAKVGENIALTLSYIEKPMDPDVFRIKEGDF